MISYLPVGNVVPAQSHSRTGFAVLVCRARDVQVGSIAGRLKCRRIFHRIRCQFRNTRVDCFASVWISSNAIDVTDLEVYIACRTYCLPCSSKKNFPNQRYRTCGLQQDGRIISRCKWPGQEWEDFLTFKQVAASLQPRSLARTEPAQVPALGAALQTHGAQDPPRSGPRWPIAGCSSSRNSTADVLSMSAKTVLVPPALPSTVSHGHPPRLLFPR